MSRGFVCPDCDSPTAVKDSRKCAEGIRRRRRCDACGVRFTTFEHRSLDTEDVIHQLGNLTPSEARQIHELALLTRSLSEADRYIVMSMARRLSRLPIDEQKPGRFTLNSVSRPIEVIA